MTAKIDITTTTTTTTGKSLDGFPIELNEPDAKEITFNTVLTMLYYDSPSQRLEMHPGDKITIEIL